MFLEIIALFLYVYYIHPMTSHCKDEYLYHNTNLKRFKQNVSYIKARK